MNGTIAEDGAGSSAIVIDALSATTPFVGERGCPDGLVRSSEEGINGFGMA
jgi:hypothetical protein